MTSLMVRFVFTEAFRLKFTLCDIATYWSNMHEYKALS